MKGCLVLVEENPWVQIPPFAPSDKMARDKIRRRSEMTNISPARHSWLLLEASTKEQW